MLSNPAKDLQSDVLSDVRRRAGTGIHTLPEEVLEDVVRRAGQGSPLVCQYFRQLALRACNVVKLAGDFESSATRLMLARDHVAEARLEDGMLDMMRCAAWEALLAQCSQLRTVVVLRNRPECEVPLCAGLTCLRVLARVGTGLAPLACGRLAGLQNLRDLHLEAVSPVSLTGALARCAALRSLTLRRVPLMAGDRAAIMALPQLQRLSVYDRMSGVPDVGEAVPESLGPALEYLEFSSADVTPCAALRRAASIDTLRIRSRAPAPELFAAVASMAGVRALAVDAGVEVRAFPPSMASLRVCGPGAGSFLRAHADRLGRLRELRCWVDHDAAKTLRHAVPLPALETFELDLTIVGCASPVLLVVELLAALRSMAALRAVTLRYALRVNERCHEAAAVLHSLVLGLPRVRFTLVRRRFD